MQDTGVAVTRWRRWGHDRLYVAQGEVRIGWWDLQAEEGHPEIPELAEVLKRAVETWTLEQSRTAAPQVATRVEPITVESPQPQPQPTVVAAAPWRDLAGNRAGESARRQAHALRDAAPVRTLTRRVLGVHSDERAWRIGADGEEKVAAQLARLIRKDPRWRVLHAIPVGRRGADIDHLLLGPGGVFTINAKHHPGSTIWVGGNTVMVNGHRQPYVRHARSEAERAARLLSETSGEAVHVHGLVVPVGARELTVRAQPEGVDVVPRMQLRRWLSRLGECCDERRVEAIYAAARRSTTWT